MSQIWLSSVRSVQREQISAGLRSAVPLLFIFTQRHRDTDTHTHSESWAARAHSESDASLRFSFFFARPSPWQQWEIWGGESREGGGGSVAMATALAKMSVCAEIVFLLDSYYSLSSFMSPLFSSLSLSPSASGQVTSHRGGDSFRGREAEVERHRDRVRERERCAVER